MSRDIRVDAYVEGAPEFARPVLSKLRKLVHEACGEVEETIKWSRPFFLHRGRMVANMAAFKGHCSFGFWRREDGAGESLRRLTGVGDLPAKAEMMGWLRAAFSTGEKRIAAGEGRQRTGRAAKGESAVPEDLARALAGVSGGSERFGAMNPSCRREYVEWIEEAKRAETRARRVAQTCAWVTEGRTRNWKYEAPA